MAEQQKHAAEETLETPAPEQAEASEQGAAGGESGAASADLPDAASLAVELETAIGEVDTLREQLLRTQADLQNVRRRAEMDVEKAHKFGVEKLIGELLPVVDSLERAIEACNAEDEATRAIHDGVEMTLKMFVSSLAKFNVEPVDPQGETFDPALHQAMSMVEAPDAKPNSVVTVVQKGYTLSGRLLRPAMVMVAKSS